MRIFALAAILAALILSGCIPATMGGFQNGYMGYPAPPPYQMQTAPIPQRQTPRMTQGTIYTPQGPVLFNSTTY